MAKNRDPGGLGGDSFRGKPRGLKMIYVKALERFVPEPSGTISLNDLATRWNLSIEETKDVIWGGEEESTLAEFYVESGCIRGKKFYAPFEGSWKDIDTGATFLCMTEVTNLERHLGIEDDVSKQMADVNKDAIPHELQEESDCSACRADSNHSNEWTIDLECAVRLACSLMASGERGSTSYHEAEWRTLRGSPRKRAFEAFRRALPDHLKEADPKKK
jgi:hypothetical protein